MGREKPSITFGSSALSTVSQCHFSRRGSLEEGSAPEPCCGHVQSEKPTPGGDGIKQWVINLEFWEPQELEIRI